MKLHTNATRSRRGAALVEYGLLVAGVAVVALAAVAILGGKVSGLFATSAAVLPGTQATNTPIQAGQFVQTTTEGGVAVDADGQSLAENLGIDQSALDQLVITPDPVAPSSGGGN
jgi:pilus assembly protein Flp/PilA